jgi:threonylcarbamoyladenosine tRNA methylthiotransferase MtaB
MKKVAFYTLGCKVNQYETQLMSERFESLGFEVVGEEEVADVYVINSCTVTAVADKKSRNYARRSKRINPDAITALIGCYAEVAADSLAQIPEIDMTLGSTEKDKLPEIIAGKFTDDFEQSLVPVPVPVSVTTPAVTGLAGRTRAYVKIEDGCDRFCSYCIVPYARGAVRSRSLEEIAAEAKALVAGGYKELVLTGINMALYGTDKASAAGRAGAAAEATSAYSDGVLPVIDTISGIPGDFRIRLGSLEPTVIDAAYAGRLVKRERVCPHLHLSLQSGSDAVLAAMGRRYTMDDYRRIAEVLKAHDPDWSITTDIIVGFPGETEEDFLQSVRAIKDIGFSRVHVFKYSKRAGTRAAEMEGQIAADIKNERANILSAAAGQSAEDFLARNKGKQRRALFMSKDETGHYDGITDNDITVRIKSSEDITNQFNTVTIP